MRPPALLVRLERAASTLRELDPRVIEPGVSNLAVAAPGAREPGDVAALTGGLIARDGTIRPGGPAAYGADPILARAALTAIRFEPEVRAVVSLRPLLTLARALEEHLRELAVVDPRQTPPGVSTMDWAIAHASEDGVPDGVLIEGEGLLLFAATIEEATDEIIMVSSHASI